MWIDVKGLEESTQQDTTTLKYIMDKFEQGSNSPDKEDVDLLIDTRYSKTCLKQLLINRQNKGLKDKS